VKLTGIVLLPWEVKCLRSLDRIYQNEISRPDEDIGLCFEEDAREQLNGGSSGG
jgi:hypothetical protein